MKTIQQVCEHKTIEIPGLDAFKCFECQQWINTDIKRIERIAKDDSKLIRKELKAKGILK